jgi:hypothetical protein
MTMNGLIPVEFDGKVFVPLRPVSLPVGAKCGVELPACAPVQLLPPEDEALWQEIQRLLAETEPVWPTVEEAMAVTRGRP